MTISERIAWTLAMLGSACMGLSLTNERYAVFAVGLVIFGSSFIVLRWRGE